MSTAKITKGEDKSFYVNLGYIESKQPFGLDGVTEIYARFKKTDTTTLEVTKTGGAISVEGSAGAGRIKISLTDAQTALLEAGDSQDMVLEVNIGSTKTFFQFSGGLVVSEQLIAPVI